MGLDTKRRKKDTISSIMYSSSSSCSSYSSEDEDECSIPSPGDPEGKKVGLSLL